jgi:hypothetical protein
MIVVAIIVASIVVVVTPIVVNEHRVTFIESGLPTGTIWTVILNVLTYSSNTSTITLSEPNGIYTYTIPGVNNEYTPIPSSGNITVNGTPITVDISFYGLLRSQTNP